MDVKERQMNVKKRQCTTMDVNKRLHTPPIRKMNNLGIRHWQRRGPIQKKGQYPRTTEKYERYVNTHMNPSLIQTHNKVRTFVRKYETKETYYENISY
jgi:hypothetical protein